MLGVTLGGNLPGSTAQANPEMLPDPPVVHRLQVDRPLSPTSFLGCPGPEAGGPRRGPGPRTTCGARSAVSSGRSGGETPRHGAAWVSLTRPATLMVTASLTSCPGAGDKTSTRRTRRRLDRSPSHAQAPTAQVLWRRPPLDPLSSHQYTTFPLPSGDLDGDGAPDVVVTDRPGQTGITTIDPAIASAGAVRPFGPAYWSAGALPPGSSGFDPEAPSGASRISISASAIFEASRISLCSTPWNWWSQRQKDLMQYDPVSRKEIYVRLVGSLGGDTVMPNVWQVRLARLSGQDGQVNWQTSPWLSVIVCTFFKLGLLRRRAPAS